MKRLRADFGDRHAAVGAVRSVIARGVPPEAIELYSRRPIEPYPSLLRRKSRMSLVAVLSAAVVGGTATTLVYRAQMDYPLVTGGMPINSGWATGVVTFETTMAGAVLGIVAALLWEGRLLRRRKPPAPPVPSGGAVIEVSGLDDTNALREVLLQAGAKSVARAD
ncbi:MAG: DUF3341 domain-containing protein [Bryobacterales bacterium]|nr:DUF3341 domain-containing protein [Bryobacterales bacterium]